MSVINIEPCLLDASCEQLRSDVRCFLAETLDGMTPAQRARSWMAFDADFTRKLGEAGWIGITWPKHYGGRELTALHRYVVLEELLAAGAPVQKHWIAERQSGQLLIKYAPDTLAPEIIPRIMKGDCCFAIGMSEPNSGSDLASVATRARIFGDGWQINGSKIWTSMAHMADYLIVVARTGDRGDNRHAGLSQFLVPLDCPGITVRPITNMLGEAHFNEVFFDDVYVPAMNLIGNAGDGWQQVTEELSYERSGPERYLSSTQLLLEMLEAADPGDARAEIELGRVVAGYGALRQMSLGVAGMLATGKNPSLAAAVVKDLGANLEQAIPDVAHSLFGGREGLSHDLVETMEYTTLAAPSFSLRGGTREILRGIIAKGLELR
ncbi:MAG TPA: acyl-CoA dehydrogenase family protein [Candidimonas sp.]|nr:acyl-CoA dehydrogenase family protein [Candidimonas sp.]